VLVIVVVLGGLAATAVIGVNAMTGNDTTSNLLPTPSSSGRTHPGTAGGGLGGGITAAAIAACNTNAGAARAASSAYFATRGGAYPTKWSDLTAPPSGTFALPPGVVINPANPAELDGRGWKLVMTGSGRAEPTFACT
jgi:hypothetical protein